MQILFFLVVFVFIQGISAQLNPTGVCNDGVTTCSGCEVCSAEAGGNVCNTCGVCPQNQGTAENPFYIGCGGCQWCPGQTLCNQCIVAEVTLSPTFQPSFESTEEPTLAVTIDPTIQVTSQPTAEEIPATSVPSAKPVKAFPLTEMPTIETTVAPSFESTFDPTPLTPTVEVFTMVPTSATVVETTVAPSNAPVAEPDTTLEPTLATTAAVTVKTTPATTVKTTAETTVKTTAETTVKATSETTVKTTPVTTVKTTTPEVASSNQPTASPTVSVSADNLSLFHPTNSDGTLSDGMIGLVVVLCVLCVVCICVSLYCMRRRSEADKTKQLNDWTDESEDSPRFESFTPSRVTGIFTRNRRTTSTTKPVVIKVEGLATPDIEKA